SLTKQSWAYNIVEYGVSLVASLSGKGALPAAGVRFDCLLPGRSARAEGERGANRHRLRPYECGRQSQLHIHAQLEPEDGHSIAFFGDGVALPQQAQRNCCYERTSLFFTESPTYAWLNQLQGMGHGAIDPGKGEVTVVVHAA